MNARNSPRRGGGRTAPEDAVKAMVDAAKGLPQVPAHVRLRDGDAPFWTGIVRARARDEWTDADLVVAAQLARCQADIEREQGLVDIEDTVTSNPKGTPIVNPRVAVLEQLARREMALMRALRMGGTSAGDSRDEVGRRRIQREAEKILKQVEDDEESLLA